MNLLIKTAFKNIINYSKQSKSTLLSIAVAFMSIVLFQGYIKDVFLVMSDEYSKRSMFGDFIIENKESYSPAAKKEPWKYYITQEQQLLVKKLLIDKLGNELPICSVLRISGMIQKKNQQFLFIGSGFDQDGCVKLRGSEWKVNAIFGKSLHEVKIEESVLLGQTLAKNFDCEKKDKSAKNLYRRSGYGKYNREIECQNGQNFNLSVLTINGQINSDEVELVGLFDGGFVDIDARILQVSLEKAQKLYDTNGVSYMTFASEDLKNDPAKIAFFNSQLPSGLQMTLWKEHPVIGDFYRRTIGLMNLLKNFVAIIIFIVVSLSVTNSLLKNIKERSKEIGTFRSLGFNKQSIRNIFYFEVVFLALFGCFIGAAVSLGLTLLINSLNITYKAGQFVEATPMLVAVDFQNYFLVTLGIVLLSVIGCNVVLNNTLKKTAAENLNHA
ncbi:MAG: ABC transporter permease [Bdellovibrionaceae bacterium]|nr:ABC transporter permease [Pseudobdellovibrionaceae bacterium]